jgi:N-acetylmuramoyl-L-alanine amidase
MHHHDEIDTHPEFPAVLDPRVSTSLFERARRAIFGERAGEQGLWYPPAVRKFSMPTKGRYAQGFPVGAVVHSTEGRSKNGDRDTENTISCGIQDGYCYFGISSIGTVYQSFLLDRWGSHCGRTWHPALGFNLADRLVGIEVSCAGIVTKSGDHYVPDGWNERFTEAEVRLSAKTENITQAGHYHRFTAAQETALFDLIMWMHRNKPNIFKLDFVLGHDEIATTGAQGSAQQHTLGRKQDPGGSLSMFMKDFRAKLKAAVATS